MTLSPLKHPSQQDNQWVEDAPLYGRSGYSGITDDCTYEVFPVHPDENVSEYERIPRDADEYQNQSTEFDIIQADKNKEYFRVIIVPDRPRIQWFSRENFKSRFCHDPLNPPRPRGIDKEEWKKYNRNRVKSPEFEYSIEAGTDAFELLRRIGKLWNGHVVQGKHLLWDKCPSVTELADGLDIADLHQLFHYPHLEYVVILAFEDADWFDLPDGYLKPTNIFRKRVWYDLEERGRVLLNKHHSLPSLNGDPHEGLVHRITVGLVALRSECRDWEHAAYYSTGDSVVDAVARDDAGQRYVYEVMTDHHNWELHRRTYRKMADFDRQNIKPVAIFDSRDTAYRFFNHMHKKSLGTLPNGTFNSDYSIPNGRAAIQTAYEEQSDWRIADWTTTVKLYQNTLGQNGPELNRADVVSLNW